MPEELNLPPTTVVGIIGNTIILADGRIVRVTIYNGTTSVLPSYDNQETVPGTVAAEAVKKSRGY